jgi:hypothetical protein
MGVVLQPVADQRVEGANDEKGHSGRNIDGIEHAALLFESVRIALEA